MPTNKLFKTTIFLGLFFISLFSFAHESRPIYLKMVELQPNLFQATWKIPRGGLMKGKLYPAYPTGCSIKKNLNNVTFTHAQIHNQLIQCQQDIHGKTITLHGLANNIGISALVRISFLSGQHFSKILLNTDPTFTIPNKESKWRVIKSYTKLGILHIGEGIDHLLFILCLLLIVRTRKQLLWVITGFTLAHSITLSLSVLKLIELPSSFVETCIALSIMFLAAEIYKNQKNSLLYRKPFLVTFAFGLLHGFGFADVLINLGLPQTEMAIGLLGFNVGIEIGQLAFIAICLLLSNGVKQFASFNLSNNILSINYKQIISLTIGSISAFWFIERLVNMLH